MSDESSPMTKQDAELSISPSEPVIASSADVENLRRFPYGYPHIVQFRDEGGDEVFAVRMRMLGGGFDVIGDTTADPDVAQKSLAGLIRQLNDARWRDLGWEDDADIAAALEAAWPDQAVRETTIEWGQEAVAWPHLNFQNIDRRLLAALPELCPVIVEYELTDGAKRYAAACKRGRGIAGVHYWRSEYGDSLADIQWLGVSNMGVWEKHVRPLLEPEPMSPSPR